MTGMSFDPGTPRPFSVRQVAERWECSEGLVRKLIRSGALQCFRLGTLIRISAAEVERFESQALEPAVDGPRVIPRKRRATGPIRSSPP